jgi:hypothetical protein
MNRITLAGGVLAACVILSMVPAAFAAAPPRGNYGCTYSTFSGTYYAGTLNIRTKSTYSVNKKKKGKYSTKGKRIKFKTGDYRKLYFGKWSKVKNVLDSGYSYKIELFGKKDRKQKLSCTRSKS